MIGKAVGVGGAKPPTRGAVCRYMKQITLPKLRDTLRDLAPAVDVDPETATRAHRAIDRMLAIRP